MGLPYSASVLRPRRSIADSIPEVHDERVRHDGPETEGQGPLLRPGGTLGFVQATDTARAALERSTGSDEVLDRFFEYSKRVFKFAVLFVVKSEVAHGRFVHGLGAPTGLVARLQFKLDEPGILSRAWQERHVFVESRPTAADTALFGSLGRAIPSALVAPVVVRGRVVAILLADGPAEEITRRAAEAGRRPLEIAKEDLTLVTGYAGDALEKLILRRKERGPETAATESAPGVSAAPELPLPRAPRTSPSRPAPRPSVAPVARRANAVRAAGAVAVVLAIGAVFFIVTSGKAPSPDAESVITPGATLAGFPHAIDPKAHLETVRKASDLKGAELLSIRAETSTTGRVDLDVTASLDDGTPLIFTFGTPDAQAEVRVDRAGIHSPRKKPRARCGGDVCARPVTPPHCSFEEVAKAAMSAGLREGDRPLIVYENARSQVGGAPEPAWFVSLNQRGTVQIDAQTCKPATGETIRPPALPLAAIPNSRDGVDPLELVALARTQSGLGKEAVLFEIDARGVPSSGRIDLTARDVSIVYTFGDPPSVPAAERRFRRVSVTSQGIPIVPSAATDVPTYFKAPIDLPQCTFSRAHRVMGDTFHDALAHIAYGPTQESQDAAQWTMALPSADLFLAVSDRVCVSWEKFQGKPSPKK